VSNLKVEVQRSGVHDLIVLFRRQGFTSVVAYFYWRISTGIFPPVAEYCEGQSGGRLSLNIN
jgi:hypothetical protein